MIEGRSAFEFGGDRFVRQSEPIEAGMYERRLTLYRSTTHDRPRSATNGGAPNGAQVRRAGAAGARCLHDSI